LSITNKIATKEVEFRQLPGHRANSTPTTRDLIS
jgi:hypothetical protein